MNNNHNKDLLCTVLITSYYVTVPLENLSKINITVVQCSALPPLKRVLSLNPIGAFFVSRGGPT